MYNWLANLACRLLGYQSGQKGIKIIDFSEVPSDVLPVVTGTLARLLYDIHVWMNEQNEHRLHLFVTKHICIYL